MRDSSIVCLDHSPASLSSMAIPLRDRPTRSVIVIVARLAVDDLPPRSSLGFNLFHLIIFEAASVGIWVVEEIVLKSFSKLIHEELLFFFALY